MLDCFDGLIVLDKTCAAGSGYMTLQSLDGINETMLANLTGPEDTVASMVDECEQWARAELRNDVVAYFANRINPRTFIDRKHVGDPDEDQELMTGNTGIGGILIEINQPRSNSVLRLGALGLYAATTGTVTITMYDLEDGSIAATYDLEVEAGKSITEDVQIVLPAYRKRKAYFLAHDLTSFYRTWSNEHGSCGTCSQGYRHGGVTINGARLADGLAKKRTNLRITSDTSGLMAVVTVGCDHGQMLCEVRNAIAMPYLYKVGEGLMRRGIHAVERMNSQRLNIELLKERAAFYAEKYAEQLNRTLGKMRIPDDPMCFTCVKPVMTRIAIP